jgi:hypothetical protein
VTLEGAGIYMVQGLGHQESTKYLNDEILLFVQPIERDFSAGQGVLVKEKREALQNQMSSFGANLRIEDFTRLLVLFLY